MIKFLFSKKNTSQITLFAFLCAILVTCLKITKGLYEPIETMFLLARDGYFRPGSKQFSVDVMISTINLLLFTPLISGIFSEDLDVAKNYLFVRMDTISKWYNYKFLQSLFYCFYSSAIYNFSILLMTAVIGYKPHNVWIVIGYVLFGTFSGFLILSIFVCFNNVFSLWIKPHLSAMIILCSMAVLIVIAVFINTEAVQFYLILNYFISWHLVMKGNELYYSYPTYIYYGVIALIICIEYLIGRLLIRKKDFI